MAQAIGLIGAGSMGGPIGANLLARGHVLVVHDIDAAAVGRLTAAGARSVASPREVADSASEVLVCLPSLEAIRTVTLRPEGLLEGTTLQTLVNF
jgi:3-hydroxyisobutyrate dehydrogenase-like beta-hydroxyacid dehydrogenase